MLHNESKNVNEWKRNNEQRDLVPFIQELIDQVKRGNNRDERPNQNYTLNVHGNRHWTRFDTRVYEALDA